MADKAEIRSAIFEALTGADPPSQVVGLEYRVRAILDARSGAEAASPFDRQLEPEDSRAFYEVVWTLISTGVLVPYLNRSNTDWPRISLTEEGRELAESGSANPADPDGFLDHVDDAFAGGLPPIVSIYLEEAVSAFNQRLYIAASVMLGVAAEGLLLQVAEAIRDSHASTSDGSSWYNSKIEEKPALQQYKAIRHELEQVKRDMDRELRERFDSHFGSIRGLIREQRNEGGHPTGNTRSRDDILPSLYLFAPYAQLTSELIQWLGSADRF